MSKRGAGTNPSTVIARVYQWVGDWVVLKYLTGPSIDTDDLTKVVRDKPEARTGLFFLEEVSQLGIVVARDEEDPGAFIPWSSVLTVIPTAQNDLRLDEQSDVEGAG
jgi:hypothetical protein